MNNTTNMEIEDFLNNQVRDYSIEILKNRAIPHIIDGFKPSARKVIYTANRTATTLIKTSALVGKTIDIGGYDKGDGSIPGVINGLTQDFPGSNNVPYLKGQGNFGSRALPGSAAAPRYTSIQLHSTFKKLFIDNELLEYDDKYEPKYFLPIIPTVLLNAKQGIAVGFACEFQPYKMDEIIKNVKRVMNGKKQVKLLPHYTGYNGIIQEIDGKVYMDGIINRKTNLTYEISEVPVGLSREQFIEHLDKLLDKNVINDYTEKGNGFNYEITLNKEQSKKLSVNTDEQNLKLFKLRRSLNENLNLISENNNLLQFNNINEIIEYFVKFRLSVYSEKKSFNIKRLQYKINVLYEKVRFTNSILNNEIVLKKLKSKKELIAKIKSLKDYKNINDLISIPVYNLNQEKIDDYNAQIEDLGIEQKYYKITPEIDLYNKDLKILTK